MNQQIQHYTPILNANFKDLASWVIQTGIDLQQIPAPTFHEDQKAAAVADLFRSFELAKIHIDEQKNVYAYLEGEHPQAAPLVMMAHTDTVFPMETDLSIRHEKQQIYGPGLGDNSIGVTGMLGFIKYLYDSKIKPAVPIWFLATSCEEGLGDLKGARKAFETLPDNIGAVLNIEGMAYGHVYVAGIAVYRLKISAICEGGHSWLHFGRPSANHAILQLGANLTQLKTQSQPRSTFNIGMIEGGHAINAITTEAALWLDMRSETQEGLQQLKKQVEDILARQTREGVQWKIEVVGDRPAGAMAEDHPLVLAAIEVLSLLGQKAGLERGSTDANIPLSLGYPAITVGITRGANAHRNDEYIETADVPKGMQQLILLGLAVAGSLAETST